MDINNRKIKIKEELTGRTIVKVEIVNLCAELHLDNGMKAIFGGEEIVNYTLKPIERI